MEEKIHSPSGSAILWRGISFSNFSITLSGTVAVIAVLVKPGRTLLTRIPSLENKEVDIPLSFFLQNMKTNPLYWTIETGTLCEISTLFHFIIWYFIY